MRDLDERQHSLHEKLALFESTKWSSGGDHDGDDGDDDDDDDAEWLQRQHRMRFFQRSSSHGPGSDVPAPQRRGSRPHSLRDGVLTTKVTAAIERDSTGTLSFAANPRDRGKFPQGPSTSSSVGDSTGTLSFAAPGKFPQGPSTSSSIGAVVGVTQEQPQKDSTSTSECAAARGQEKCPHGPSTSAPIVKGTQLRARNSKEPAGRDAAADETVVLDTAQPNKSRLCRHPPPLHPHTPAPTKTATTPPTTTITAMKRKRGRSSAGLGVSVRPEKEQIFRNLSFFYIPNDDVAPARRLRIEKAREFGAAWVRTAREATHVVVDADIGYADVRRLLDAAGEGRDVDGRRRNGGAEGPAIEKTGRERAVVVNDAYPVDCLRFRALLDHGQKKYLVRGQPEPKEEVEKQSAATGLSTGTGTGTLSGPAPGARTDTGTGADTGTRNRAPDGGGGAATQKASQGSVHFDAARPVSLQEIEDNDARGGMLLRQARDEDDDLDSQRAVKDFGGSTTDDSGVPLQASNPTTTNSSALQGMEVEGETDAPVSKRSRSQHQTDEPAKFNDTINDELSQYISMMQEFKHLPLDMDDDGDDRSMADGEDAASDSGGGGAPLQDSDEVGSPARPVRSRRKTRSSSSNNNNNSKSVPFEDRFACNQAGAQDLALDNPNSRTIEVLQRMASYYDRINDHWRTTGYRKAITTLKRQPAKVTTEEQAFRLPHIGRRIAQKIEEIATTDKLQRLAYAEDEPTDGALQLFLGIYGVGTKQAQQWIAQGFRTLDDLLVAGGGAKLNPSQRVGVDRYEDLNTRIPRSEVEALGAVVREAAGHVDAQVQLIIGGSYRRGAQSSGDIDLIVTKRGTDSVAQLRPFLARLVDRLEGQGFLLARLASFHGQADGSKWHGCCALPSAANKDNDRSGPEEERGRTRTSMVWRRIDFLLVPETEMGAALIYFTGNDIFNRSMRLLAGKRGMKLNQRGLYQRRDGAALLEGRDERRIFAMLGVKWREPHERWC
ncbi:DNA polymerase [Moelleriella libera RCEF 2490]|uniref:DNA-directed DNA polymerase n=1 Tax=Moelleriella libera RCEF 2490 TaxID=1081109 RepID=A0A168DEH7_9HYPO|nr:DNA polymerase [Moelleriella libera RCEF 2490]